MTATVAATDALLVPQVRAGTNLFTVSLTPAGAYTVTLVDNVLHAAGGAEANAPVVNLNYLATDSDGDSSTTGVLAISFNDDAPTANADSATQATENAAVTVNVFANDDRGADDTLVSTVAVVGGSLSGTGTLVNNGDGSFTYTPGAGETGIVTFQYSITDRDGDPSTATATITLLADSVPVPVNVVAAVDDDGLAGNNAASTVGDIDANLGEPGATPSEAIYTGAIAVNFGGDTGTVSFANLDGTMGMVGTETVTYAWNAGTNILTATGPRGVLFTVSLTPAGAYTVTLVDNVLHATGGAEANTPVVNLNYLATDSDTDSSTAGVLAISFNDDAPTANADSATQATENAAVTVNVFANDDRGADDTLVSTVAVVGGSLSGTGTLVNNGDGSFTYTPGAGETGIVTFQYSITDRDGDPSTATATITLLADSVPVPVNVVAAVDDDALLGGNAASTAGDIDANAGEPGATPSEAIYTGAIAVNFGGDTGTVSFANLHGAFALVGTERVQFSWSGTILTATVAATDALLVPQVRAGTNLFTVSLTPAGAYTVTLVDNVLHAAGGAEANAPVVNLNYLATDSDGDSSTTGVLAISFNDDAPTANADSATQATENAAVTVNVFANDDRGADDTLVSTVAVVGGSLSGTGTLVNNGDGSFTYTPGAGETGIVTFQYSITDRDGDPSTATATITLLADSVPVPVNVVAAVDDDGLAGNNAASTVGDIDANLGEPGATPSEAIYTGAIAVNFGGDTGTVSFANLDGTMGMVGTETVTYAWNAGTNILTATGPRGVLFTVSLTPAGAYTVTLVDNVLHATGGAEANTPVVNLNYLATDSDTDSSTAGVLAISFNDDAPTANADSATQATENAAVTVNVFANDDRGADDTLVSTVAVVGGSLSGTGTLVNNGDGSFTYTPGAGETGIVTFQYSITDRDGDPSTATATITLLADSVPVPVNVVAAVDDDARLPAMLRAPQAISTPMQANPARRRARRFIRVPLRSILAAIPARSALPICMVHSR